MNDENTNIYEFQKMNGAGNTFLFHDSRNHKLNINNDLIFKLQSAVKNYRFDQFISIENASRNKIQIAAKNGFIYANDNPVKQNYKVKPGDEVKVMFTHPPYENLLEPEKIEFEIIFEDKDVLVVRIRYK